MSNEPSPPDHESGPRLSRRGFLQGALAAAASTQAPHLRAETAAATPEALAPAQPLKLNINGKDYALALEPRVTLLDALREYAGLTGTKKGCDRGQCGACTILVDGKRINSCLALAISHDGADILTIEGVARGDQLHPLQAAFIAHDGFQCGFCTPGQIMSAIGMMHEAQAGNDPERIRECMSGNLCRCGAYAGIVDAVREAQAGMDESNQRRSA